MSKIILCRGIQGSGNNIIYIERDAKKPNPIGEEVIRKTYERYKNLIEER